MKRKFLNENQIAELMMLCGALHDLAEIIPDKIKAAQATTIQHKIETLLFSKPAKPPKLSKREV